MRSHYRFGSFELQPDQRRLLGSGTPLHLGAHAFDVLVVLVEQEGRLVTKDQLLEQVWGKVIVEENTLQANISALRKVLGADAIATISGRGYRFAVEVARIQEQAAIASEPRHNLPQQLTSFIGRDAEIAQLSGLLGSTRLLTLTGAGGCGKTRLALQVAANVQDNYPDGTWLVELAPLGDPTLILQTVASALRVKEKAGEDLAATLTDWLQARQLLLVLDNAEHMIAACAPFVDSLLRRCAGLSILVTSREHLGIAGELTHRVPSLSVPDVRQDATREEVLACESARLFVDRARLQRTDFDVASRDAAALASICRRLDGIALAIELAAPRVRSMSLEELRRRLDDRFALLTGGSRAGLPRQRTLRSLIDWSHELLDDAEKAMLRRASVFAGGWTLEAGEQVGGGDGIERTQVLDLLTSLADKNLVVVETSADETRFGLLESMRHYARDRLRESGEEDRVRDRHASYLLEISNRFRSASTDIERRGLLARLDDDNMRAALAWCETDPARSLTGLQLAGSFFSVWRVHGNYREGRNWIARLLAVAPDAERGAVHATAFVAAGSLANYLGDFADAEARYREALALWRKLGDRRNVGIALTALGTVVSNRGNPAEAREIYEEALAVARDAGDQRTAARLLQLLGFAAHEVGDYAAAAAWLEEGIAVGRQVGTWQTAGPLTWLAEVRQAQGNLEAARPLLLEALQLGRDFADPDSISRTLFVLASVSQDGGDMATAKAQLLEAAAIMPTEGTNPVEWLEAFAGLAPTFADATCAARLWGCLEHVRQERGFPKSTPERARHERRVAAARGALQDDAAFDRAWGEGRSWSLDEAVKYALGL